MMICLSKGGGGLAKRAPARAHLTTAGTWDFRWETGGSYQGVDEFSRVVAASEFT